MEAQEQEIRKCPICDKIMTYCHNHGQGGVCMDLLLKLKKGEISEKDFQDKMCKAVNFDDMMDYVVKPDEA